MYKIADNCDIKGLAEIYEKYFDNKTDGFFVEIGAYNGYDFSNVSGLVDVGWSGICVEPNPLNFKELLKTYKDKKHQVTCIRAAIGERGIVMISMNATLSTTSAEQIRYYKECDWINQYIQYTEMDSLPLNDLLEQCINVPFGFDLLSIDTEGTELAIMQQFNIGLWKPKMVIIEAHENHPIKPLGRFANEINKYFARNNYERIYSDFVNNIYWKDK